ncbi:hypothetical protein QFZ79_000210 [Arthrobacter sp. V4I6]|uniref:DUF4386 domain-containing protein n=1 Tax=unclassified Arthrobacter TaxID=235627 RepID=UPI0027864D6C|nr:MULTISPECIES: DUF4386 domain-containing protein [unclassified Arthrobacter]MDQ0822472.1 hypothetical protein [Arthrobacter sp. V1I7]MDQ0852099.1 hypothetical protein [Arthrobacter sp. V4I6]
MNATRRAAVVTGVFFLLTEISAIGGMILYGPLLAGTDYIVSTGTDTNVLLGAMFEIVLVISNVGTAIAVYPIVRRHSESLALGYLGARLLESAIIVVGIISLLTVVTLKQDLAGTSDADPATLVTVGRSLLAIHEWTFLFGPNFALGTATLLLASLMFTSRLVPRAIAVLGLAGGALVSGSAVAVMFGAYEQLSMVGFLVALPVFAWEVSLAVWLILKGFSPSALAAINAPRAGTAVVAGVSR